MHILIANYIIKEILKEITTILYIIKNKNQFNPYLINKTLKETTINLLHNQENHKERTIELYTMAKPSRKKKIRSSI